MKAFFIHAVVLTLLQCASGRIAHAARGPSSNKRYTARTVKLDAQAQEALKKSLVEKMFELDLVERHLRAAPQLASTMASSKILEDPRIPPKDKASSIDKLTVALVSALDPDMIQEKLRAFWIENFTTRELRTSLDIFRSEAGTTVFKQLSGLDGITESALKKAMVEQYAKATGLEFLESYESVIAIASPSPSPAVAASPSPSPPKKVRVSWTTRMIWKFFPETKQGGTPVEVCEQ